MSISIGPSPRVAHILERASAKRDVMVKPGKRLFLTHNADVVPSDHEDAAFLLVSEHGSIPKGLADELGIKAKATTEEAAATASEDKNAATIGKGGLDLKEAAAETDSKITLGNAEPSK